MCTYPCSGIKERQKIGHTHDLGGSRNNLVENRETSGPKLGHPFLIFAVTQFAFLSLWVAGVSRP